jgi:hypothetical protein
MVFGWGWLEAVSQPLRVLRLGISIRSVYETVAGFDLGIVYGYIEKDLFEIVENKAHALVKQLVSFRQRLK